MNPLFFYGELPMDHRPCFDHEARSLADYWVEIGEVLNWDHAYESAWNYLEGMGNENQNI